MAKILIADDNPAVRNVVREYIQKLGRRSPYEFVEAQTGEEALERIRDSGIHVAVMSQQIGRLTGEGVAMALRRKGDYIPCAIMTGDEDTFSRIKQITPPIPVFRKPTELKQISDYVDSVSP